MRLEIKTSVSGVCCRCMAGRRFYVANSEELNRRAFDGRAGSVGPFLFKVGSTKICRDRIASLNENRKPETIGGSPLYKEPAYAGATDWRILRCWDVEVDRYDDNVFKTWVGENYDPCEVRTIGRRMFSGIAGLSPTKGFDDLCFMSEHFVRSGTWVGANHPLHDEMLRAASDAIVEVAASFASSGLLSMHEAA